MASPEDKLTKMFVSCDGQDKDWANRLGSNAKSLEKERPPSLELAEKRAVSILQLPPALADSKLLKVFLNTLSLMLRLSLYYLCPETKWELSSLGRIKKVEAILFL